MLNPRAREVFRYVARFSRDHGYPPTLREIGGEFGIASTNGVRYYLGILERDGYLRRNGKISRGIEILESGLRRFARLYGHLELSGTGTGDWTGIPILGPVAAGNPLLAVENQEGKLDLDSVFPGEHRFALRIKGESMRDAGILDGDLAIVRRADRAENGDIVVALIGDEATVKTYQRTTDRVVLHPSNPNHRPITVKAGEEFRILGVVIGVVRHSRGKGLRAAHSQ